MPKTLYQHRHAAWGFIYLNITDDLDAPTVTAYTEEEEAAHIREIVTLAMANVDPADFDRCGPEELVDRTIRAMGAAITSLGGSENAGN